MDTSFFDQRNKRWTLKETAILKNGFKEGKCLKQLAKEMGRSETAVNKFLSRSGIRGKCRGAYRKLFLTSAEKMKKFEISAKTLQKVYKNELQADISDVVSYLRSHGHVVDNHIPRQYRFLNISADFIIDGRPILKEGLVMRANKLRIESREPIFSIPSIIL
ncbi:MAG: hypothetical protein LBF56_01415 [Holosporales bacterium]|jgi:IS30 family transposase|nr:hypothetical protein [Holosporales bacterium]